MGKKGQNMILQPTNRNTQNKYSVDVPRKDWEDPSFLESMFQWDTRWPNFRPVEIACKCCGHLHLNYKALDALQQTRRWWRSPMRVQSGYRCPKHNNRVGGAKASKHLTGQAFDIYNQPWSGRDVASFIFWATKAGFTGFGLYKGFIHIDTGPHRAWEEGDDRLDPFDMNDPNELE